MIKQIAGFVSAGFKFFNNIFERFRRKADREAGAQEERLRSKEKADEARDRMDGVKPAGDSDTTERLRRGDY